MKPIAISLEPDEALKVAIGEIRILLTTTAEAKRKILIHSCSYATMENENTGFKNITELGFEPGDIPVNSIIGWARISEVKIYDSATFAIDGKLHGRGVDLNQLIKDEEWQGQTVYGYLLDDIHYLHLPIMGIGSRYQHGDFWEAISPFEVVCFERALAAQSVDIAASVGY